MLESKYDGWKGYVRRMSDQNESLWWRDLLLVCDDGIESKWFVKRLRWRVGEGDQVRFWIDNWEGGGSFVEKYPRFFLISLQQNEIVKNMGLWREDR